MTESFNQLIWKSRVAEWWREAAKDLDGTKQRLGVNTAYGLLTASALLPLLDAYAHDPGQTVLLVAVASGVSTNLLPKLVRSDYDAATAPGEAEQEIAEQPALRAEYQQVLAAVDAVAAAQVALGNSWDGFSKQLVDELDKMGGSLKVETGGGAVVFGGVTVQHGDFVAGDKVTHLHIDTSPIDPALLHKSYLSQVEGCTKKLPLFDTDVAQVYVAQVYVELDVKALSRAGHEGGRGFLTNLTRKITPPIEAGMAPEAGELMSALEATIENPRAVLIGKPGSGKSTFARHLAYCLAMAGQDGEGNRLDYLTGWPEAKADALPVLVVLRDFARWAAGQETECWNVNGLFRFLERWLTERELAEFADPLRQALHKGKAIVFFDGLDEIPTRDQRALTRDAVANFAQTYKSAHIVVTCRTLFYQDSAWQLPTDDFPVFELMPLDDGKIGRFIDAYYEELDQLGVVPHEEVGYLAGKLRKAIRRDDLHRMANNPLLLTMMARVHTEKGRLPETRVLLYEECTNLLLWEWEEKDCKQAAGATGLHLLAKEAGRQVEDLLEDLKPALWKLAFETHPVGRDRDDEATTDIPEHILERSLRELHPKRSRDWAADVVKEIRERAGLLVEHEPEVYAFPHPTFQEYLAACHLSVQDDFAQRAADKLTTETASCREVVLLAVGRQVHVSGNALQALALVAEICPAECGEGETGWRQAWLAGEVLQEAGVDRVRQHGVLGREQLGRVRDHLTKLVEGGHLAAHERAEAGDLLGRLSDLRFDPEFHFLPRRYQGEQEPFHGFMLVSAGRFVMGSDKHRESHTSEFGNPEPLAIPYDYWVGRYPVTVAQYGAFVDAGGYEESTWWTGTGWAWRQGKWKTQLKVRKDEVEPSRGEISVDEGAAGALLWRGKSLLAAGVTGVEGEWKGKAAPSQRPARHNVPSNWLEQRLVPNRPVVSLSWFEAVAYANWLTAQLQQAGDRFSLPVGYVVRLPTEAEWEKAARAGDDRRYPWGNEGWDKERANIHESQIGHANPVGMYPRGVTPSGLHEMGGNVWEWTASLYQPYPYKPDDGRNDLEAEGDRVSRGGSWHYTQYHSRRFGRCACRNGLIPELLRYHIGFRVVVSLPLGDSAF